MYYVITISVFLASLPAYRSWPNTKAACRALLVIIKIDRNTKKYTKTTEIQSHLHYKPNMYEEF